MNNLSFLYSLYNANGGNILTQSVTGNRVGTILEHIAKTVYEHQQNGTTVDLKLWNVRIDEATEVKDKRRLDSIAALVTLATEHYNQKAGKLVVENIENDGVRLVNNLKTVLSDPKKIRRLVREAASDKAYTVGMEDGYVKVKHPEHGTVAAGYWNKDKKLVHGIEFPDERHQKINAIRQPAMTALAKWQKKQQKLSELELPSLEKDDVLLVGKWKNRKAVIKGFEKDENNQPVAKTNKGDQKVFKPRIAKLMPQKADEAEMVRSGIRRLAPQNVSPHSMDREMDDYGFSGATHALLAKKMNAARTMQPPKLMTKH